MQFAIEDCSDSDIFLCDHTDSVYVDRCTKCRIFIGPCEGSVFLRNCTDCEFVVACQQLRTREIERGSLLLFCTTEPVIEMTKGLKIGCFSFNYFSLPSQFEAARLSVWDNRWSEVFDFTPEKGNWRLIDESVTGSSLLRPLHAASSHFSAEETTGSCVPITLGSREAPAGDSLFVVLASGPDQQAAGDALLAAVSKSSCALLRTRVESLEGRKGKELQQVLGSHNLSGKCVGVEIRGSDSEALAVELRGNSQMLIVTDNAADCVDLWFNQWKESAGHALH